MSGVVRTALKFTNLVVNRFTNLSINNAANFKRLLSTGVAATTNDSKIADIKTVQDYEEFKNNEFSEEKKTAETGENTKEAKQQQKIEAEKAIEAHPFAIAKAVFNPKTKTGWQPTLETHSELIVDGVPYNKLSIVHISATKNNTILTLTDQNGVTLYTTSAGACGFKNSKKSTAIAGQAAGLIMCDQIKRRGIKNVRVTVKGFGNGRLPSIKALQLGKVQIISITDRTPIPLAFAKPPRPPAQRTV